MALGTTRLEFLMTGNASGLLRELDKVGAKADKEFGRARSSADKWATGLTRGGAAAVGFAAVVGGGLLKAAKASEDAQKSLLKLENTIANAPKLAGETTDAFVDLATAIQKKTAADADQIVEAEAMLGTFQLTGDEIRKVTPLVVDYARKFGVDLVNASIQVGKALDGQIGALRKNGVSIDEVAYKADKFGAVTEALRQQVGGFAEAEGKTFAGQMESLKNQLGDVVEGIGSGVVPVLEKLIGPVKKVSAEFSELDPAIQKNIGTIATVGTVALAAAGGVAFITGRAIAMRDTFRKLHTEMPRTATALGAVGKALGGLGVAFAVYQGLNLLSTAFEESDATIGEWTTALERLAEAKVFTSPFFDQFGDDLSDLGRAIELAGDQSGYDKLNRNLEQFWDNVSPFSEDKRVDLVDAVDAIDESLTGLVAGGKFEEAAAAFGLVRDAALEQGQALPTVQGAFDDYMKAVSDAGAAGEISAGQQKDLTEGTDDLGAAADDAAEKIDQVKRAEERYAEAAKRTEDAIRDQTDAVLAISDLRQDIAEANDRATEAETAWQDAIGEFGPKSAEARSALHELQDVQKQNAQNAADLKIKMLEASGATVTQERKTRILAQSFRDLAGEIGKDSPLYRHFIDLAAAIDDATEDRSVKITYDVTANGVRVPLFDRGLLHLAEGGPVKAREPVVVGEEGPELYVPKNLRPATKTPKDQATVVGVKGPELFVPPAAGEIIPNDRLDIRAKRATGGPVEQDRRYLVGEKGPEVYIPRLRSAAGLARKEVGELAVAQKRLGGFGVPNLVQASMYMAYELDHLFDKPLTAQRIKRLSDVAKVFGVLARKAKDSAAVGAVDAVVRIATQVRSPVRPLPEKRPLPGPHRPLPGPQRPHRPLPEKRPLPGPQWHGPSAFIEAGPSGRGSLTDRLFRPWAPSRERDAAGRDPRLAGLTGMPAALAARLTGERVPKPTPRKGSVDERFRERLEKRAVLADARRDMPSRVDVVSIGRDLARTIGRAIPQTALSGTKATKSGAPMTINITMPPGSDGYDVVQALEKYRRRNGTFPWTGAA